MGYVLAYARRDFLIDYYQSTLSKNFIETEKILKEGVYFLSQNDKEKAFKAFSSLKNILSNINMQLDILSGLNAREIAAAHSKYIELKNTYEKYLLTTLTSVNKNISDFTFFLYNSILSQLQNKEIIKSIAISKIFFQNTAFESSFSNLMQSKISDALAKLGLNVLENFDDFDNIFVLEGNYWIEEDILTIELSLINNLTSEKTGHHSLKITKTAFAKENVNFIPSTILQLQNLNKLSIISKQKNIISHKLDLPKFLFKVTYRGNVIGGIPIIVSLEQGGFSFKVKTNEVGEISISLPKGKVPSGEFSLNAQLDIEEYIGSPHYNKLETIPTDIPKHKVNVRILKPKLFIQSSDEANIFISEIKLKLQESGYFLPLKQQEADFIINIVGTEIRRSNTNGLYFIWFKFVVSITDAKDLKVVYTSTIDSLKSSGNSYSNALANIKSSFPTLIIKNILSVI